MEWCYVRLHKLMETQLQLFRYKCRHFTHFDFVTYKCFSNDSLINTIFKGDHIIWRDLKFVFDQNLNSKPCCKGPNSQFPSNTEATLHPSTIFNVLHHSLYLHNGVTDGPCPQCKTKNLPGSNISVIN